jgi:hypothetical protein
VNRVDAELFGLFSAQNFGQFWIMN